MAPFSDNMTEDWSKKPLSSIHPKHPFTHFQRNDSFSHSRKALFQRKAQSIKSSLPLPKKIKPSSIAPRQLKSRATETQNQNTTIYDKAIFYNEQNWMEPRNQQQKILTIYTNHHQHQQQQHAIAAPPTKHLRQQRMIDLLTTSNYYYTNTTPLLSFHYCYCYLLTTEILSLAAHYGMIMTLWLEHLPSKSDHAIQLTNNRQPVR